MLPLELADQSEKHPVADRAMTHQRARELFEKAASFVWPQRPTRRHYCSKLLVVEVEQLLAHQATARLRLYSRLRYESIIRLSCW